MLEMGDVSLKSKIRCFSGGMSSVETQFRKGWLVVMKMGSLFINSLSA